MGYLQTILFFRDFNRKKCTDCNFVVLFLNFFDSGVNFCGENFCGKLFRGNYFCGSWKKTAKIAKIRTRKKLVPQGIFHDISSSELRIFSAFPLSTHHSIFISSSLIDSKRDGNLTSLKSFRDNASR